MGHGAGFTSSAEIGVVADSAFIAISDYVGSSTVVCLGAAERPIAVYSKVLNSVAMSAK